MYTGASDCKTEFKKQNKKMTFPLLHHSSMMYLLPQISIKSSSNIFFYFTLSYKTAFTSLHTCTGIRQYNWGNLDEY